MIEADILILPGWQNSDEGHWQTLFERKYRGTRVEQSEWMHPKCKDWVEALDQRVSAATRPVVFLAHSLGCCLVAHWAAKHHRHDRVAGAFLVAPPDLDQPGTPVEIMDFRPTPMKSFPFPAVLIGTDTDSYCSLKQLQQLAASWKVPFLQSKMSGHINIASGNGPWPEGEKWFEGFLVGNLK